MMGERQLWEKLHLQNAFCISSKLVIVDDLYKNIHKQHAFHSVRNLKGKYPDDNVNVMIYTTTWYQTYRLLEVCNLVDSTRDFRVFC